MVVQVDSGGNVFDQPVKAIQDATARDGTACHNATVALGDGRKVEHLRTGEGQMRVELAVLHMVRLLAHTLIGLCEVEALLHAQGKGLQHKQAL